MRDRFRELRRALLLLGVAGPALMSTVPAFAQNANAPAGLEDEDDSGEEVIVTARRREENLLDVPISLSVLSGAQLEASAEPDIVALQDRIPNLTLEVTRGTNTTISAFIRGVGQQDPVAGFEAGVGIYIDDVYLNRPQAAVLDIYDVERIEVLRGPQGTLYGRNTIGGAVKYITKRLGDDPELKVRLTGGTFRQFDGVLTFTAPVTETLAVGGTVARFSRDGFGDNLTLGTENYERDVIAGRVSVEYEPNDRFFLRLTGDYSDDNSVIRQGARLIPDLAPPFQFPVLDDVFDTRAGLQVPESSVVARGVSASAEFRVNDQILLRNIFAWRDDRSETPIDFDALPAADVDVPVIYDNQQFSEEFQIVYTGERIAGIAGFYFLDAGAFNAFDVILAETGAIINLPGLNAFTISDVNTSTWSIFGDVTFDLLPNLSLSVGGRYTSDERNARLLRQTFLGGFSPVFGGAVRAPIATAADFTGTQRFKDFSGRANVAWKPTENLNLYFSFSQGFKGGGFDPRGSATAAPDLDGDGVRGAADPDDVFEFLLFEPENVNTYEIGAKASLFDNRVRGSLALFRSDYSNVQIPGSVGFDANGDGINETFIGITSNAADADIRGFEFEGQADLFRDGLTPGDTFTFAWSLGYIDAQFNSFIDAFGRDVANERVFQNTPRWNASAIVGYEAPLTILGQKGQWGISTQTSYRGDASQFEVRTAQLDQEAYILFDASMTWRSESGRWQFGVHGKNLTDKEYIVAGYNFINPATGAATLGREGVLTAFFGNPRQILGTVALKF